MDDVDTPNNPLCCRDEIRVACAISEIKKNITLNRDVLTNNTAQCAPDIFFLERLFDRFLDECLTGFAIENPQELTDVLLNELP